MINLLPPQKLANIRIARSNTVLRRYIELTLLSLAVILTALVVANYFMNVQQANVQRIIDEDQKTIAELEPVQKEAKQFSATVNTIAGLLTRDVRFSTLLEQIGGVMPNGAVLTGIQYSTDDLTAPLVISAQVENEQIAAVLLNNINASDLFASAEIQSINSVEEESSTPSSNPDQPVAPPVQYKYNATINAYFKPTKTGAAR
jgi:Tfp pilus assembly protein PilN